MFKKVLNTSIVIVALITFANSGRMQATTGDLVITNKLSYDVNFALYSTSAGGPTQIVKSGTKATVPSSRFTQCPTGTMIKFWTTGPYNAFSLTSSLKQLIIDSSGNYGITLTVKDLYYPEFRPYGPRGPVIPARKQNNQTVAIDSHSTYPNPIVIDYFSSTTLFVIQMNLN